MKKNNLRYKALKRCAKVNENVAIDLLKLKRSGVDVKNFIDQVENIEAPYSIVENYNFMSLDDVDVKDIKESLMELGASRKLLSEAVVKYNDEVDEYNESRSFKYTRRNKMNESKKEVDPKEDLKKRQAELDKIVDEIKAESNLDKKSAKKYTTRLKKIKDLKNLKKAKSIIKKLSKVYPEAADILTESLVLKVVEAAKNQRGVLNENLRINNFHISSYSLKELKECYNKVEKNVKALNSKIRRSSLNESCTAADIRKLKEDLKKQTTLLGKLDEEISWKMLILSKGGIDKISSLLEGEDTKEEKKADDAASDSLDDLFNNIGNEMEDNIEDAEGDEDTKKEEKDTEDDDVELDSITITMKSEDAANALKDALVEKGVPEDAIEVEAVEDEDEAKNESMKYSNKFMRLFEDEEISESDDEDTEDSSDNSTEESSDESNDDSEDKSYNVTLTDTDYVNSLKDVMVDEYGYTEDEFWDSIGGKPVEDDEDEKSDEDKEDDDEKKDDEDDTSELDSIGADIFGDQ